jgi:hypothetical protein
MAGDWLTKDYFVLPEAPNSAGLMVEYLFDGGTDDYNDTSGNNLHGTESTSGASTPSGTLSLDGVGYVDIPFGTASPFGGTQDFSISMWFMTSADQVLLISSSEPNDVSGCDMAMNVYVGEVENPGEVVYDSVGINWMGAGTLLNDGEWHHMVTTYDAATLQHHIYANGVPETWPPPEEAIWDPNITDITTHTVRIGWTYCDDAGYPDGQFVGYIDDVRIYDYPLSQNEVMYLGGGTLYVPLVSPANFVPKVGPFGWNPNNVDMINFKDYTILADHWLEGPTLWP